MSHRFRTLVTYTMCLSGRCRRFGRAARVRRDDQYAHGLETSPQPYFSERNREGRLAQETNIRKEEGKHASRGGGGGRWNAGLERVDAGVS